MKALLVTDTLQYGGAERHTLTLAKGLKARGLEVSVISVKEQAPLLDDPKFNGISAAYQHLGSRSYIDPRAISRLRNLILESDTTFVLTSNLYATMHAVLARVGRTYPPIAGVLHTTRLRTAKERAQYQLYRRLCLRADKMVFLCRAQRDHWIRAGFQHVNSEVILSGIDSRRFSPGAAELLREDARRRLEVGDHEFVIGCSAMLRPEKNHLQQLQALRALRDDGIPAVLAWLGEGPMRGKLIKRANEMCVGQWLRAPGLVEPIETWASGFDVGLLNSLTETFSLAALELMGLGIPMVLSDQGGAREMIQSGANGQIVETGNLKSLVAALRHLSDLGTRRRMGMASSTTVQRQFGEDLMLDNFVRMLDSLANQRVKSVHN